MKVEPIEDYVIIALPEYAVVDDRLLEALTIEAQRQIISQYDKPPKALMIEPIDWLVTSSAEEVERHQPAHKCAACLAGNDRARAYLAEFPDRCLALGNLRYTEVWA